MIGLEVDARVCDKEESFDLDKRQNLLNIELSLELGQLADVLQPALIELDLLVRHDPTRCISNRRIVQTLCHSAQYLKHFFTFIVKLISRGDVRLEEQSDRLEQIIDVSESNINVQTVLLRSIVRGKCMCFVGLRRSGCAWDLN